MDSALASLTAVATTTAVAATTGPNSLLSAGSPAAPQAMSYTSDGGAPDNGDEENGECRLLGPFSILVQAALGALALLSLVFKRWRERPQRPLKVWGFDVSKQVFGSAMLHLANLLMSMFSAGQLEIQSTYKPNPCSFYLLNLGIDVSWNPLLCLFGSSTDLNCCFQTTLGIPILIFVLHILNALASYTPLANPPQSIESGNYGHPPRAAWWFKQSIIYFIGLLGMKICVFFIIQLVPFVVRVGDWALQWTEGNTAIQIFFVMLLFPVIMNAIQYYIIDTLIKKRVTSDDESLAEEDGREIAFDHENDHRRALLAGLEDDGILEADDISVHKDTGQPEPQSHAKGVLNVLEHIPTAPEVAASHSFSSSSSSNSRNNNK